MRFSTAKRLATVFSLSLCALAPTGCFLLFPEVEGGEPYVKGNPFDEAIWHTSGGNEEVAMDMPKQIERLLRSERGVAAIEGLLTKHGAKCERENRGVRCTYRKTRLRGKMADHLTQYDIEVVARPSRQTRTVLAVCATVAVVYRACFENELK